MNFLKYFLLATLLHGYPSCSMGQTIDKTIEANYALGLKAETNLIKNPSAGKNRRYVTAVGLTPTRDTSAGNKIDNKASWSIDATAINDYQEFELIPTPDDLTSGNCGFSGIFKGNGTLYRAQILDGSSNVLAQTVVLTNETGWREFKVWHPCGASGARKVRITQTEAGTAPAINVGKLFYGRMEPGSGVPPNTFTAFMSSAGVVSGETGGDWINGICTISDTSFFICIYTSGFFTQTPSCNIQVRIPGDSGTTSYTANIDGTASTTSNLQFRTAAAGSKTNQPVTITCTKTGADYIQPAITPAQWNFATKNTTPIWGNLGFTAGVNKISYSRVDDRLVARGVVSFASGTGSASFLELTLPEGLIIDTGKMGTTSSGQQLGTWSWYDDAGSSGTMDDNFGPVLYLTTDRVFFRVPNDSNQFKTSVMASNDIFSFEFSVPIVGWTTSNAAPQLVGSVIGDTTIKADKSAGVTSVDYGTANVTFTGGSNIASITSTQTCRYIRIGSIVEATCPITATCTAGSGNLTTATFTLPVSTTQGSTIKGVFGTIVSTPEQGWVTNSSNNGAVAWRCGSTISDTRLLKFSYEVP